MEEEEAGEKGSKSVDKAARDAAMRSYPLRFNLARDYVRAAVGANESAFSVETRLLFYALLRQVEIGPCNEGRPWFWGTEEDLAKWKAWSMLGDMKEFEAMRYFVRTLDEEKAEWSSSSLVQSLFEQELKQNLVLSEMLAASSSKRSPVNDSAAGSGSVSKAQRTGQGNSIARGEEDCGAREETSNSIGSSLEKVETEVVADTAELSVEPTCRSVEACLPTQQVVEPREKEEKEVEWLRDRVKELEAAIGDLLKWKEDIEERLRQQEKAESGKKQGGFWSFFG